MLRFTFTLCATLALQHGFAAKLELLGAAEDRIEGEYIVGWHDDEISTQLFEDVKTNWQLHFENEPTHLGELLGLNYLSVKMSDEEVAHVENLPGVEFLHHDMVVKMDQGPAGSQVINRRGLLALDVLDGVQDQVYNYLNRGDGVDVYVLDTGIDIGHPDWAPGQALFLADCVGARSARTCNTNQNPGDPQGHGTHVAGISSSPTFGVAKDSTALNVRVLGANGSGSTAGIIAGIEFAVNTATGNGARANRPGVINMSLGGGANRASNNAADAAVARGIPVIVAAGNDAVDARQASPASAQNVVTVGSTVFNGQVSSFSNTGPALEIFATGSQWESLRANTDGSVVFSGTSMACPTVAGAVAQLLAVDPSRTPAQITNILIQTSRANVSGNALPGTQNRFLTTNDATFFGSNGQATQNTQTQAPPATAPPQAPPVNADNTLSSRDNFGAQFVGSTRNALSRGVMFDVSVAANAGAQLDSISVFSAAPITNGQAAILAVTDRGSYRDPPNRREGNQWTLIANQGTFQIAVNSDATPVNVGGFNLFRNELALPTPLQLASGANQGLYVQMISNRNGDFLVSDARNVANGQATSDTAAGVTIREASQVLRRAFGNFRPNVFPVVELGFDSTAPAAVANDAPSSASSAYNDEVSAAQTGNFMRITNENMNTDEFNVANGVFFDLTVDSAAAASLPGVYLEDFEIWLVDSLQNGGAQLWTTRNRGSFVGQEGNRDNWGPEPIASLDDLNRELAGDWTNPDVTSDMPGLDDIIGMPNPDAPNDDENAIVEPIEVAPRPERYAFNFNMNYPLKTDGTAQGFYLTFTSPDAQMRVYEVAAGTQTETLASDNVLTLSGGQGASYPFDVRGVRQFAGSVSYGTVARESSFEGNGASTFMATSFVALAAATVFLVLAN